MMRSVRIVLFSSLAMLPFAAGAASPQADVQKEADATGQDRCNRNDMSQQAMTTCADFDYAVADQKLNKLYGELTKVTEPGDEKDVALLRKAQRAWIAFRDAECDYAASASEGGSIYPMLVLECLTRLTEARIKQLQNDLACDGGGDCDAAQQ